MSTGGQLHASGASKSQGDLDDEALAKRRRKQQVLEMLAAESGLSSSLMLQDQTQSSAEAQAAPATEPALESIKPLGMKLGNAAPKSRMSVATAGQLQ